jgi:CheY-like chemotaxis protein
MKHTLLIVDDNEVLLKLLKRVFEKDYNVYTASDGVEAMSFLSYGIKADLIISDLNMNNISGYELIKHLSTSSIYKKIPVIVLTASSDIDLNPLKDLFIVAHVLNKPFDPLILKNVVTQTLSDNYGEGDAKYQILKKMN